MRIGFGLVTCQRNPADPEARDDAELYRQAIQLAKDVEAAGLDSYWVSEHHFQDDGYLPSLLPLLAAAAAATERITLATGLLLAPLADPVRVAEDAAVVDLISRGRLLLGLGMGWREEEFAGFGVELRERVQRMRESVATLRAAWSPDGAVGDVGVTVTPKPFCQPGPPIVFGGVVEKAVNRAAELGDGFAAAIPPWDLDDLAHHAKTLRALDRPFEISAHVDAFVWDGPEDPWKVVREYRWYIDWKYADAEESHGDRRGRAPAKAPPVPDDHGPSPGALIGRPEQVLKQMKAIGAHLTTDGHLVVKAYYPGLPWDVQRRQVQLLGQMAEELRSEQREADGPHESTDSAVCTS